MKTSVEDLKDEIDNIEVFDPSLDTQQLRKKAIDLFISLELRIRYLVKVDPEQLGELISCINGMYSFSRTIILKQYILEIAKTEEIPLLYRIECAKSANEDGYSILNQLCKHDSFVYEPTPIRVETVMYLMKIKKEEYKESSLEYFCDIINDIHIEDLYRFKLIQSLENHFKDDLFYFYANEASRSFVAWIYNRISYRVICCQYIFQKCEQYLHIYANEFLLGVASQPDIDEDIRADACDILLAYGTPENIENARMILFVLGGGDRARNNIFKNSQNVHNQAIEDSVEKMIEFISTYIPRNGIVYTFEKTKEELEDRIKNQEKYDKTILAQAIIRITIDRAIYGRMNLTLYSIIAKMWTYIQDSEYRQELENRLLEELIDSNNKCSSGYVSRIVNSMSGFGDMSLTISFHDQIISVLETRLNEKIQQEDDMDTILEEMILPVRFYDKRGTFLRFFRKHISIIREEMYEEFKNHINTHDFDLFFRKAIMHYEGVI